MGMRRHDLARAMALALETPPNQLTPQVRQEVVQQCEAFADANLPVSESDSAKLGEDLIQIYKDAVMANPAAEVLFLQCMSRLAPCLVVEEQVRTWVDLYSKPAIDSAGQKNDLVRAACDLLVAWMVPRDGVEGNTAQYQAISRSTALYLVQIYLHENLIVGETKGKADAKEERLRFVRMNAKNLILTFAEERPQEFCVIANRFFVQPEYRVRILVLLSAFFSQTRAKIPADLARSQLVKHLFACLLHDKSSQVVTMAASALIMMLPFICSKVMTDLPYLFAVYGRMVCWRGGEADDEDDDQDASRGASDSDEEEEEEEVHTDDEDSAKQKEKEGVDKKNTTQLEADDPETPTLQNVSKNNDNTEGGEPEKPTSVFAEWQALPRDNVPDAPNPDWERMFTFLYGLFPSNFILFLRKPTDYISETLTPPDDWDDYYISQRSKTCFDRHLLHVQLLTSSSEQELKDEYRWAGMTPADIASLCLSLLTVSPTDRSREDTLSVSSGTKGGGDKDKEVVTRSRGTSLSESKRQFSITSIPDRESTPSSQVTTSTEAQVAAGELLSPTLTSTSATGHLMDLQARHQSLYGRKADFPPPVTISTLTLDDSDSQGREESPVSPLTRYQKHSNLGAPTTHTASIEGVLESGTNSSPALSPTQLPVGSPILRGDSTSEQADILAYYQRELLLIKNELDFVCYLDYHNQFRIRQLKEQLHSALRQDIDVQNLVTSNQKLKRQAEQLNSQLVKMKELGNTLRTQKVQHEGTLTKRNRELRLQCDAMTEETAKTNLEFEHMQAENQRLYAAAMAKEAAVTQLELKVESLETENRMMNEYREKLKGLEGSTESSSISADNTQASPGSNTSNSDLHIELEKTKIDLGVLKHEKETTEKRLRDEIAELEEQMNQVEKNSSPSHKVLEMLDTIKQEAENRYHQLSVSHQELSQRYQDLDERFRTYAASSEAENLSPGAGELFNNTNQKSLLGYDVESLGGSSGNSHRTTKQSSASLAGSDSAYYRGVPIGGNSKTPSPAVEHLGMNFGGHGGGGSAHNVAPAAHIPQPQPPSHSHSSASQDEDSSRPRARGRGGWQNAARKSEAKKINSFRGFL